MAINESIYGAQSTWLDTAFYDKFYHNKKVNFGDDTSKLSAGVTKGKLSYTDPIDKTLSYCGLGTECALSHVRYFAFSSGNVVLTDSEDRYQTNFLFSEITQSTGTAGEYSQFQLSDLKYNKAWQSNTDSDQWYSKNKNKILEPYVSIHPKSVVFLIYVVAYKADGTYITESLSEYVANHTTTYPRISQVFIIPYMNRDLATEQSPVRRTTGMNGSLSSDYRYGFVLGLLDEYKINSQNFSMYSYSLSPIANNIVMGNVMQYQTRERTGAINICYVPENVGSHLKSEYVMVGTNYYMRVYIEYYEGLIEEILKTVACFGLYFTGNQTTAERGLFTDNNMYIGLLDNNGIGHGDYLRGSDTVNAPQNNYSSMQESGYDYTKEVDKTKYVNNTLFYNTWTSSAFTKMYVLRGSDVSSLANELYTAVSQAPQGEEIERYNQSVFLTQNPIDCIISLKKFPIEIFPTTWTPTTPIKLGSYTCNTSGSPLPYATEIFNFTFSRAAQNGLKDWFDESFLDFEQYTKVELSIPFCGTVEIPCCYLYDYDTLEVKLIVDFITGACTAYILSRGITIDSVSGECAVNLPVNGVQAANLDAQIYAAAANRNKSAFSSGLGLIGGLATMAIGIATGGIAAAVAGGIAAVASGTNMVVQDKKIEYELQHMQLPLKQISAASGAISQSYDMRCKMRITRPKLDPNFDPEVYADTVGYACLMQGQVKDFTGLTVGEIDLDGVAAPEPVKKMLQSLFAEGVYL
ncbi:MAG: hypothetical protein J6R30_09295 [Bacteroidales bacterium]|nr:hypothetical protein [Bacteroidales bacterium]